jgi:nucleoside-diphosphate-sugar epimerase
VSTVVVTGGSGKAGRAVVSHLAASGYAVVNVDVAPPREGRILRADLTNLGETIEALRGSDAVVHLAAIPAPGIRSVERTFDINIHSTFNVFSAATLLGLGRVVWASSETVLGLPFGRRHARNLLDPGARAGHVAQPDYLPIDEAHPRRPHSSYSLSKVLGEEMAVEFARWSGIPFVGLRFSAIREPDEYAEFPDTARDPHRGEWNAWGYVDARDGAQACRLSLEADVSGAEVFIIAAADTNSDRANGELLAECFPDVPVRHPVGDHETLLAIDRARQGLGYAPAWSWRDVVGATAVAESVGGGRG